MSVNQPPCYEDALAAGPSKCMPYINKGFERDHDNTLPPTAPSMTYMEEPQMVLPEFHGLSNEGIRNACYEYVDDTCCYGTRAIRDMIFQNITSSCSLHYKLESFTEKRQSASRETPYHGQDIDGPENGPPPAIWNIRVSTPTKFEDGRRYVEIPHTAYVKTCWNCSGRGEVTCSSCGGSGSSSCSSCSGSGRDSEDNSCSSCGGSGSSSCIWCSGSGKVTCSTCDGHGKLKHYEELIVTWKNNIDNFVANPMNIPEKLLIKAAGRIIFIEENPVVSPLTHSPDVLLNEQSFCLINKHRRDFSNQLILMQRQTLCAIPITKVDYAWKRKVGEFYVYSFENEVYFEKYPQKCCCCICC
nr:protein SSUH2 homolog isoform X2 [Parasteatoda tepidariorum]